MGSRDQGGAASSGGSGGFFSSIAAGVRNWGTAVHKSVNGLVGYEGLEVINPDGGTEDAEAEALRGRWKQEDRDSYWKMMNKYIGTDVTSLVTLPVIIFEPMTMLQKMAEVEEPEECSSVSNARKEQEHVDPSLLSVLEPTFLSESCWSSECSGTSDGSKGCPSCSEVKNIPRNFLTNPPSVDTETKTTDSASSASIDTSDISDITQCSNKSRNTELEYIGDVLSSVNLTTDELGSLFVNQDGSALDPLLFDKLENMNVTQGKEPIDRRWYRRLLFDCVNECLETRRLTYFRAGYAESVVGF